MIIGEIRLFAFSETPMGFLECKGQSVSIQRYRMLYVLIGNRFGPEEDSEFRLPDLRRSAPYNTKYFIAAEGEMPEIIPDVQGTV